MKPTPIHADVRALVHEILLIEALKIGLLAHTEDLQERGALIQGLQEKVLSLADILPPLPHAEMQAGTGESVPPKQQFLSLVQALIQRL